MTYAPRLNILFSIAVASQHSTVSAISSANTPAYYNSSASELVQVPQDISVCIGSPQFQPNLLRIKAQTSVNCITLNRDPNDASKAISVTVDSFDAQSAVLARTLLETHFKQQRKLLNEASKLDGIKNSLYLTQGELASGMQIEVFIQSKLIGLVIGVKGARIKKIQEESGVTAINVDSQARDDG